RIAATITGTYCSAIPTAAITESSENTMSITAICAITAAKELAGWVWMSSDSCSPATWSRISAMPLNTRKTPPSSSTRSRTEKPWPITLNTSSFMCARKARVSSRAMRVMQAAAMPNLRARSRWAGGRRLTAMEMNTRLSMPSTISIELRVTSRIHVCGSASIARLIWRSFPHVSRKPRPEHQGPDQQHVHHRHEHGGRAHVLGAPGQLVVLAAVAFDHRLDGGVEQFDRQHQQATAQQQRTLDAVGAQPQRQRAEDGQQVALQAERGLVQRGGAQLRHRPLGRGQDAARAPRQVADFIRQGKSCRTRFRRWNRQPPDFAISGPYCWR